MRPRTGPVRKAVTERVVAWGSPEAATGPTNAGSDPPYDLVKETTGETVYALRDPELLLSGRVGTPTLVSGPVVGVARGLPLLRVVRAE